MLTEDFVVLAQRKEIRHIHHACLMNELGLDDVAASTIILLGNKCVRLVSWLDTPVASTTVRGVENTTEEGWRIELRPACELVVPP